MEVFGPKAGEAALRCGLVVARSLEVGVSHGILKAVDAELGYVPIIMPVAMHEKYRERSRLRVKARLVECCPQLQYAVFTSDDRREHIREFMRGLSTSIPYFIQLGLKFNEMNTLKAAFEQAESDAAETLAASHPARRMGS